MAEGKHYRLGTRPDARSTESVLQRWVRRKRHVAEEAVLPPDSAAAEPPTELPPIDSLTGESDFSAFLSPEVDEALRRAALRKLFHLADFNITDGLNDYDDDYSLFEPLGETVPYHMKQWLAAKAEEGQETLEASVQRTVVGTEDEEHPESTATTDPVGDLS